MNAYVTWTTPHMRAELALGDVARALEDKRYEEARRRLRDMLAETSALGLMIDRAEETQREIERRQAEAAR
jgi:hypothetical protein